MAAGPRMVKQPEELTRFVVSAMANAPTAELALIVDDDVRAVSACRRRFVFL
jgi:hypothetical protein